MRHYELMIILDPNLEERTVQPSIEGFLKVVTTNGGTVWLAARVSNPLGGWDRHRSEVSGYPGRDSEARCRSAAHKGNLKRHGDTERPWPGRTGVPTSRKTGSVMVPGEGGLTGILFA